MKVYELINELLKFPAGNDVCLEINKERITEKGDTLVCDMLFTDEFTVDFDYDPDMVVLHGYMTVTNNKKTEVRCYE